MTADVSASELLRRCRAGDVQAREQLFARYYHYLHVLAQAQLGRHLRTKCSPSDLVQQTLLEAHRDFPAFQGRHEGELLAWLRRMLAHNLFNEARHFGTQQRDTGREISLDQVQAGVDHSSLALQNCLPAETPSPSQQAVAHEASVRLADALARLPEDYRAVLMLRIFEGLSAEEVAQRMQRSAGAVRMLQMRALTALRAEMSPQASEG